MRGVVMFGNMGDEGGKKGLERMRRRWEEPEG